MSKPLRFTRILIMMSKSFLYGIILTCLFTSILLANDGNAQHKNIKEVMVSVDLQDASLRQMINVLEVQTAFKFIYSGDLLSKTSNHRITLSADNKSIAYVLQQIASATGLIFQQNDGAIAIGTEALKEKEGPKKLTQPVLEQDISGKVTDVEGAPLPGASVLVKGTSIGVITDADGNYRLSAPDDVTTLVFSYVGYERLEVAIGGRVVVDVSLMLDVKKLGEIVVSTGYWETEEKLNPGNIAKINSEEIENQPVYTPLQTLQGRVAGLDIRQSSGVPGGGFSIRIRGENSVRLNANDPLIIIDGVPFPSQTLSGLGASNIFPSPLNAINPSDIESIEVLKDADATAVYGSLAANGVILITTKKGKPGKTAFDVNIYKGAGEITRKVDLLNTEQYLQMRNEAFTNDGFTPDIFNAPDLLLWDTTRQTDWQEELLGGTANTTNAQLSISGGNSNNQFLVSGGYYRETSVFPEDFPYQKGSLHFHGSHTSNNNKFNASLISSAVRENSQLPSIGLTSRALILPPIAPAPFNEEGNLNWENDTWNNPYADLLQEQNSITTNLITNLNLGYEIIPGVQLKTNAGYNFIRNDLTRIVPIAAASPTTGFQGESTISNNEVRTWNIEPQLSYSKSIGNGELNVLIGSTFRETIQTGIRIRAIGFSSDAVIENLAAASNINLESDTYTEYRYNAIFGRINYTWGGKYIVNVTGRRDGSSRFGPNNRLANFGALGAAWIFSRENFLEGISNILSFGKLRFSYGTVGNDQIGDYQFLPSYLANSAVYQGKNPINSVRLANPDYQWERTTKLESAIELGFVEDRVFLKAIYYRNRSSNQLVEFPLPAATGFTSVTGNLPAVVQNSGVEFELRTTNVNTSNFTWSTSMNLSVPRNELVEFPNLEGSNFANIYVVGEPLTTELHFQNNGVDPQTGVYQFNDFNEDEIISFPDDNQIFSDRAPKYYGGLLNTLNYKGFALDFLFQFVNQRTRNHLQIFSMPGTISNQPTIVMDRWQEVGDQTEVQRFSQGFGPEFGAYINQNRSDASFSNTSFIRLKNISLSYQFPKSVVDKLKLQNLQLYVQAQNLLIITDYEIMDPETPGNLPPIRMVTGGINFSF